jgi:hypothetical protein
MQESYRREPAASTHACSRPRSTCPGAVAKAPAGLTAFASVKARPSIRLYRRLPRQMLVAQ